MIKEAIKKLKEQNVLNSIEITEVFDEINSGLADFVDVSSFVALLDIKKLSENDISKIISSSQAAVKKINLSFLKDNLIENIYYDNQIDGYFNLPLAVDLVCCATNLGTTRYSFIDNVEQNNSFKILKELKINPLLKTDNIVDKFEKTNFLYFYIQNDSPYYKYTFEISKKMNIENIFNVINPMLNPTNSANQLIGIKNKDEVNNFAQIALELNNVNSIVLSSNTFPYVSMEDETWIAEAWKNKIFSYVLTPDLLDIKRASNDSLKCENNFHCAEILTDVFVNNKKGEVYDFIVLNSALSLYIAKKADSLLNAVSLAKKTIDDGIVKEKIEQLRKIYS